MQRHLTSVDIYRRNSPRRWHIFLHENALLGPYSVSELKAKVQSDDLVKDDAGTWRPASSLPGWNEADDDIVQLELSEASSSKVGQPDVEAEGGEPPQKH